jgi:integral membrane sensor domain MASE1
MKYDIQQNPFDKVMMTGVFIGIILTVLSIFCDVLFLEVTGFPFDEIINVSSLIFSINILFLVVPAIYYGFTRLSRYGTLIFIAVFVLSTLFLLLKVRAVHRTDNEHLNSEFRVLLSLIILIMAAGAILIPFLVNNKKFRKYVI